MEQADVIRYGFPQLGLEHFLARLKFIERRGYSLRVDAGGGLKGERRKGTDVTEGVRPAFA
jgi:hypothetical protein